MALYIPHSIFHLARLLYVRPETFGPYYVHRALRKVHSPPPYFCQIWKKLALSRHIFENKILNIKFHKNPSSGNQAVPREWTEGQTNDEANDSHSLLVISRLHVQIQILFSFQNFLLKFQLSAYSCRRLVTSIEIFLAWISSCDSFAYLIWRQTKRTEKHTSERQRPLGTTL